MEMEWTENGMEWRKEKSGLKMEWTGNGNGVEMEWTGNGKKDKSEEWEDEWIMIPPTPLNCPNRPWLVMTGLNFFYFIYLVYNRWEDKDEERGER